MKKLMFLCFFLCWSSIAAWPQGEALPGQPAEKASYFYFDGLRDYNVKILSEKGVVLEFDVPKGVYLAVEHHDPQFDPNEMPGGHFTFHGDAVLRLRRVDEVAENESQLWQEVMDKGPAIMNLRNVVLVVTPLGLKTGTSPKK